MFILLKVQESVIHNLQPFILKKFHMHGELHIIMIQFLKFHSNIKDISIQAMKFGIMKIVHLINNVTVLKEIIAKIQFGKNVLLFTIICIYFLNIQDV